MTPEPSDFCTPVAAAHARKLPAEELPEERIVEQRIARLPHRALRIDVDHRGLAFFTTGAKDSEISARDCGTVMRGTGCVAGLRENRRSRKRRETGEKNGADK